MSSLLDGFLCLLVGADVAFIGVVGFDLILVIIVIIVLRVFG